MNISEIERLTFKTNPYFFSRGTLKFFGQTKRSFKVRQSPTGRVFIYAPSYWDGKLMGYTFREYKDGDLLNAPSVNSIQEIEKHISNN